MIALIDSHPLSYTPKWSWFLDQADREPAESRQELSWSMHLCNIRRYEFIPSLVTIDELRINSWHRFDRFRGMHSAGTIFKAVSCWQSGLFRARLQVWNSLPEDLTLILLISFQRLKLTFSNKHFLTSSVDLPVLVAVGQVVDYFTKAAGQYKLY